MLDRPIFIIGAGRSGSTAFFHLLSKHPDLAWLTGVCNRYPDRIGLNRTLLRVLDTPLLGDAILRRQSLGGGEVYRFWDIHLPGFSQPKRDLVPKDVTQQQKTEIPALLARTLTPKRVRFMTKLTGWPRIGFLNELFPDALFIHVMRDGRAVANSYLNVDFWRGWDGPEAWRWGPLSSEQEARWQATGRTPVGLAGLNWEILMDSVALARETVPPQRFHEVRYEEMCDNPEVCFRQVIDFCGLRWATRFQPFVEEADFKNTNKKYKETLNQADQQILESILAPTLPRFGYDSSA